MKMLILTASQVTGTVTKVARHGHTRNGNPMMSVTLAITTIDGTPTATVNEDDTLTPSAIECTLRIQNDSGIVYAIENSEYRDTAHVYTLTPSGRISNVKVA